MAGEAKINVKKVIDAQTVTASSSYTSAVIPLDGFVRAGEYSLQISVTGDGTCKFEYLLSVNDQDYIEPASGSDIASGITKTSGPGSDGKEIYSFATELARFMKIKVTETGTSDSVVVNAWLALQ